MAYMCNAVCIVAHQVVKLLEVNCTSRVDQLINVSGRFFWFVLKDANRLKVILDVWIELQLANIYHLLCCKHNN